MSARAALRAGTAADHAAVDAAFGRFDLGTLDGYRRFLAAQAAAFVPVEAALTAAGVARLLPDWESRQRTAALRADLAALSITEPELFSPFPHFQSEASMLGAIYVLEGSRLGGALLKRSVPLSFPRRFLDAHQEAGSWRKLLKLLDEFLIRPHDLAAAILAAREVFARFATAAEAQEKAA